jgi:hypothetical protein
MVTVHHFLVRLFFRFYVRRARGLFSVRAELPIHHVQLRAPSPTSDNYSSSSALGGLGARRNLVDSFSGHTGNSKHYFGICRAHSSPICCVRTWCALDRTVRVQLRVYVERGGRDGGAARRRAVPRREASFALSPTRSPVPRSDTNDAIPRSIARITCAWLRRAYNIRVHKDY